VNIGRRNESNGKAFERLDQSGEFLGDVRSNLDADEHAWSSDIGAHHRFDGDRSQNVLAGRLHSDGCMGFSRLRMRTPTGAKERVGSRHATVLVVLPAVEADQLDECDLVRRRQSLDFITGDPWASIIEHSPQSGESEMVSVGSLATWRTGTRIAGLVEAVNGLLKASSLQRLWPPASP
jgi:hypothetical protein